MIQKVKNKTKDAASWDKIGEVIKLIETLSYQVLKIVNSPTTAYRRTNDITDASYQLGTEKLEQLLKTIRFSKLLPNEFPAYGTVRDSFWEHSVVTGLFMQKMAQDRQIRLKYFDNELQTEQVEDDFYSIGLLHDFGKVIFDQVFTVFYREVLVKEGKGYLASHENERKYPFDHAKVGAWAIKEADFPLQFARMVFYHHSPSKAEEDIKKLCCILYLAEYFLDSGYQPGAEGAQMSPEEIEEAQWAADYLGTDLAQVAAVIDELQRGMESKKV
jgi:HD-like signal output (HDOD) protein